jgi:hypothetical protein
MLEAQSFSRCTGVASHNAKQFPTGGEMVHADTFPEQLIKGFASDATFLFAPDYDDRWITFSGFFPEHEANTLRQRHKFSPEPY